jgi:hypothetical protein
MRLQDLKALMRAKGPPSAFQTLTEIEVTDTCFVEVKQTEAIAGCVLIGSMSVQRQQSKSACTCNRVP